MQMFRFNAKGAFGLTISRYPLATRMTLTSEKDLRMSSRVVVVKVKTFCDEFAATLCSTACSETGKQNDKLLQERKLSTENGIR